MTTNLFDYFEAASEAGTGAAAGGPNGAAGAATGNGAGDPARPERGEASAGAQTPWAARTPRRPDPSVDMMLFPRARDWSSDPASVEVLERLEGEPWIESVSRRSGRVELRLADSWIQSAGAALEAGGGSEATLADLASGRRFSVQFWDPNATKALHVGHLRNLAIGNAIAASFAQAGAQVERRSLISDAGRSIGEAMAGVTMGGRHAASPNGQKSDHFVGVCYADYVASGDMFAAEALERSEDSHTREVQVKDDAADSLLKAVLAGDREALALWYQTRAWVISGQRKTLARLGIAFDRVFFESDFLSEAAKLMEQGLQGGWLRRREDGVVVYPTGLEDLEELPLVRADGLPTQYMRSLSYCVCAPELDGVESMQVCGSEWVSHAASIRKLVDEWKPNGGGDFHPRHSLFHGMVSRQKRAVASSDGALLVDDLVETLDEQIDSDSQLRAVRRSHPHPEGIAAQISLGFFLPHPVTPLIEFEPEALLDEESFGWELVRARARHGELQTPADYRPADDPDYRFAVVQSEIYRRHLRLALERFDVTPLALYLRHLARWYMESERNGYVERVVHTLLDRGARGLGLEGGR